MHDSIGFAMSRKGEIVEGDEDDIRATYYILAFQREFNDNEAELRWKVVDMMVVGGEPDDVVRLIILKSALGRIRASCKACGICGAHVAINSQPPVCPSQLKNIMKAIVAPGVWRCGALSCKQASCTPHQSAKANVLPHRCF